MQEKKESLIVRVFKKFSKKKEEKKVKKLTPEQAEENLNRAYQAYCEEKKEMSAKERLDAVNKELWLSDDGG